MSQVSAALLETEATAHTLSFPSHVLFSSFMCLVYVNVKYIVSP